MILWILLLFIPIILLVSGLIFYDRSSHNHKFWEDTSIWGAIPLVFFGILFIFGTFFSSLNQINDLEAVEYYENSIIIQEKRLERLTNIIQVFDYPDPTVLMNADTPVGSTIQQIGETEKTIAKHKESIEQVKRNIRQRERWLFSFIPKLIK